MYIYMYAYVYICIYIYTIYIYQNDKETKETKPSHQVRKVSHEHSLQFSAYTQRADAMRTMEQYLFQAVCARCSGPTIY